MEKFELTVVAQGPQSIWVAVIVIGLLCVTVTAVVVAFAAMKSSQRNPRVQWRSSGDR
jgi:hypothetical protein